METQSHILNEYLTADVLAYLQRGEPIPDLLLQQECSRLRTELDLVAAYIPHPIVQAQLATPRPGQVRGAFWEGSVLFADLTGFTALSAQLSALGKQGAEEISAIINRLFAALVEEVYRYHGSLLKFGGDALTAFFDVALDEQHAMLASGAALAMQQRMAEFATVETRSGQFRLQLRIGVHSGRVFATEVGDDKHLELVVTGKDIHRVAQAQEIAAPGQVIVSEATHQLLYRPHSAPLSAGFLDLTELPLEAPGATRLARSFPFAGSNSQSELIALAERLDALYPYLPHRLPRRFLASDTGEFRPVTVLFANLRTFSDLLEIVGEDAETAARLFNSYYHRAQEVVHYYGGIINKVDMYTSGDKLMALFGAPVANEDDAERAVRAALELKSALEDANRDIRSLLPLETLVSPLQQQIGINTGVVFAGTVGAQQRREYTVMGQHVNLAARLMSVAAPQGVLLSASTQRLVRRRVALRECPPVTLKGIVEPVAVAEALYALDLQLDDDDKSRQRFVGRTEEVALLVERSSRALRGSGQILSVSGEAGIGKTRLLEEVLLQLVLRSGNDGDLPAFQPYGVECQSYEQNTPYALLYDLLHQIFRLPVDGDRAHHILTVIKKRLPTMVRFAPLLGDVLGVVIADSPVTAGLTAEQRHDRAQELIVAFILAEARRRPLTLIVDDLQWCDASSLEILSRLAQKATEAPLLLMFSYRNAAIDSAWRELPHCVSVTLHELSAEASARLVQEILTGAEPVGLSILVEKAQGNPFFIEEVVRGLIEIGALQRQDGTWSLNHSLDQASIPDSVEGVITARLDRLEEQSREVLQAAAVVGRRFPYPILSGLMALVEALRVQLQHLTEQDLIASEEATSSLPGNYQFKHALTRDVAYESILYARRRELHRRVAQRIEDLQQHRIDEQLTLLAQHYRLAEEWEPAFSYHLRAGRQAQGRYANREAITLFQHALEIYDALPNPQPDAFIELHERLGVIYALIGEYETALQHYLIALEAVQQQPTLALADAVRLHHHIARVYEKRAEFDTAFSWVEQALQLAHGVESQEVARCLLLGAGLFQRQGRYQQALEWGQRAQNIAEQLQSTREAANAYMLLGGTYRNLGDNSQALALTHRSLQLYTEIGDLGRRGDAHNNLANIYDDMGQVAEARRHYEHGAEFKEAIGDIYGQGMIACNLGELLRGQGLLDEAIEQYERALAIYERIGSYYMTGVLHMNLGAAQLSRGDEPLAEQHLGQAADDFERAGSEDFLPELDRYLAELHLRRNDLSRARLACELSLSNAARLEARLEEGLTRRTLGRVLVQSGDLHGAWSEWQESLAILRDVDSPQEIIRTLLSLAELAPALQQLAEGQAALSEALGLLANHGHAQDIAEAQAIARLHGYRAT